MIARTTLFELNETNHIILNCISTNELVQRFWEPKQVLNQIILTNEDKLCEFQFKREHKREDSSYSVSLSFKPNRKNLGN